MSRSKVIPAGIGMKPQRICQQKEIPDPGCKQFTVSHPAGRLEGFIVHRGGRLSAFVNHCPHTGVSLNWLPDQFFDRDAEFIQCSLHGALFRPDDGYCVRGPCAGRSLERLELEVRGEEIWIIPSHSSAL